MIIRCSGQDSLAAEGCRRKQPWSATGASSISKPSWGSRWRMAARCLSVMNAGLPSARVCLGREAGLAMRAVLLQPRTVDGQRAVDMGVTRSPIREIAFFLAHHLQNAGGVDEILHDGMSRKAPPGSSWESQRPNQEAEGLVRQRAALEVWKGANSLKGFWCAAFWCAP